MFLQETFFRWVCDDDFLEDESRGMFLQEH